MKRNKRSASALLLAPMLLVSLAAPANATSIYDGAINSVSSVHLSRDGAIQGSPACASMDVTTSWASILISASAWTSRTQVVGGATRNAMLADWATTRSNGGGWAVVQQHQNNASTPNDGNPIGDAIYVVFTPSASAQINFSSDAIYYGAQKQAYMTNSDGGYVYSIRIQLDDLGSPGGSDQCTPVISLALRDSVGSAWFKEILSVAGTSTEASGGYSLRPLFIKATVNYPQEYQGELVTTEQPPAQYVAMGDSFSSGKGNPQYEHGTDESGVNECHRSARAYPRLLQNELNLGSLAFVACSGATTNDVLGIPEDNPEGRWTEPAQIDALTDATDLVTVSIGGNDAKFAEFANACLFPVGGVCDEFTDVYKETVWRIENELPSKLENVYAAILNEAENATIYVVAYPILVPSKGINEPFDQDCGGFYDEFPNTWGDARAAYQITVLLNGVIEGAVAAVNTQYSSSRLVFVPVENGAFSGHDLCADDSFFNGIVFPSTGDSVHPNAVGHVAYKEDLIGAMN